MLLYLPWHLRFASSTPLFAYSELRLLRLMTLNGWLEREPVLNATSRVTVLAAPGCGHTGGAEWHLSHH
jgi:hypothetical protein